MQTRFVLAIVVAGACSTPIDTTIKLDKATPDNGSLLGGTHIIIEGQGFRAAPNHVVIGETEAPLASVLDDGMLEVVTPPGTMPGDAKITVFNPNGNVTAMGLFSYSTEPAVTSVTPADVVFDAGTTVTLTGSGFKDNGAGYNHVTVDGIPAVDVVAVSDTQLTFTAPVGKIFTRPTIKVTNDRGEGTKATAYRNIPSNNPVLLMFSIQNTGIYAVTYDPMTQKSATVDNKAAPTQTVGYRAVVRDSGGKLWAIDRNFVQGKLDIENQKLVDPVTIPTSKRIFALAQIGNLIYACDGLGAYGTYDLAGASFTTIAASGFTRASQLIADGTNEWWVQGNTIQTVTPTTGAKGTAITLSIANGRRGPGAVINGTMYFVNPRGGSGLDTEIYRVDPATGTMTLETTLVGVRLSGTTVFLPGTPSSIQ